MKNVRIEEMPPEQLVALVNGYQDRTPLPEALTIAVAHLPYNNQATAIIDAFHAATLTLAQQEAAAVQKRIEKCTTDLRRITEAALPLEAFLRNVSYTDAGVPDLSRVRDELPTLVEKYELALQAITLSVKA